MPLPLESVRSVSYTHLDVYKRQQLGILEDVLHLEGLGGLAFADIRIERDNATKLPRVVGDLSVNDFRYAHEPLGNISMALDVYKRQGLVQSFSTSPFSTKKKLNIPDGNRVEASKSSCEKRYTRSFSASGERAINPCHTGRF